MIPLHYYYYNYNYNVLFFCQRVLVVDDEIFNIESLRCMFNLMKCEVINSFNGKEAIEKVEEIFSYPGLRCCESCGVINFILMDCSMPIMNGWEATKILV